MTNSVGSFFFPFWAEWLQKMFSILSNYSNRRHKCNVKIHLLAMNTYIRLGRHWKALLKRYTEIRSTVALQFPLSLLSGVLLSSPEVAIAAAAAVIYYINKILIYHMQGKTCKGQRSIHYPQFNRYKCAACEYMPETLSCLLVWQA